MPLKSSEIKGHTIGSAFTEYKTPDGTQFTYNHKLKRLVLDDGTGRTYTAAISKTDAKQKILNYCSTGSFAPE